MRRPKAKVTHKRLRPIFKWPGGKSGELTDIRSRIKPYKGRFVEPFLGGGAVWLDQNPRQAIVSDLSEDTISLFWALRDPRLKNGLKREMLALAKRWDRLGQTARKLGENIAPSLQAGRADSARQDVLNGLARQVGEWLYTATIQQELWQEGTKVKASEVERWQKAITTKLKRIVRQEARAGSLSLDDLYKNVETALRTAFYSEMRWRLNTIKDTRNAKRIAAWFFVRDLCYASMFRYNDKGEFNIPYGGMGYNSKKLLGKVSACFNKDLLKLVRRTVIKQEDFLSVVRRSQLNADDFVFLDPPYDSEFNAYEGRSFGQERQRELADFLRNTPADFLLVIKETPFIAGLYDDKPEFSVERIKKTYLVNVKNRNARAVSHLYVRPARTG